MAKINFLFDNKDYSIDEQSLAPAISGLESHLSTVMNGSGASIKLRGNSYDVDSTKLSNTTSAFADYLETIADEAIMSQDAGSNYVNVVIGNTTYRVDRSKLSDTIAGLHTFFSGNNSEDVEQETYTAGLYQTGAIALYQEQDASAIDGMLIKSWDELLADGTVHVDNGVVYTNFDTSNFTNSSSSALAGDLMLPSDGSVTTIGDFDFNTGSGNVPFAACTELTGIKIPNSVANIGFAALQQCRSLTTVEIPSSVNSIGAYAFSGCSDLTSITIPDGVPSIGEYTFDRCYGLTSITIPDSVITIGDKAFQDCHDLINVEFGNGVTSIGEYAFEQCSFTAIVIPDSVTNIGDSAFYDCKDLISVEIGNGVESIGVYSFGYCINLNSVVISNSVVNIGSKAFLNANKLSSIYFDGSVEEWNAISKGERWNDYVPATEVVCSDGTVEL